MVNIADYWATIQLRLFPYLEEVLPAGFTKRLRDLCIVLDVIRIERQVPKGADQRLGRIRLDRRPLARAFVAKACYNIPTTEDLWERLLIDEALRQVCGWERRNQVPSLATFSRAFAEFAKAGLVDRVHAALVAHDAADTLFWHVSRDSTPIEARERPAPAPPKPAEPVKRRPRGRPRGSKTRGARKVTRMERQYASPCTAAATTALLAELPCICDTGRKHDSKGFVRKWNGYKLHVDVGDTGLPLLAVTTSASLHDSQVAIPMARLTAQRVRSLYDLMDAAYDAALIRQTSAALGHVPIIDQNPRQKVKKTPMEPDRARRFCERTTAERFNSDLKDNHGGRTVRVRTAPKVHTHLMFGLLVIFAHTVLRWR